MSKDIKKFVDCIKELWLEKPIEHNYTLYKGRFPISEVDYEVDIYTKGSKNEVIKHKINE